MQIVNRNQQVITQGIEPRAYYSRVVNLYLYIAAGLGAEDFEVTPSLGNNLWLSELTMTFLPDTAGARCSAFVYVMAGSGKDPELNVVLNQWTPIVVNTGAAKPGFQFYGTQQRFAWHMNKRYIGEARRFGCVAQNLSAIEAMRIWISFEISEG